MNTPEIIHYTPVRITQKENLKLFRQLMNKEHLEQNPEHRNHRTYRHRHHLRGDLVHGRVNNKRAQPLWNALSFQHSSLRTL